MWATIPPTTTTCPKLGTNPPSPKNKEVDLYRVSWPGNFALITGPKGIYSHATCPWPKSWATRPYSGPWPTWTGTTTASRPGRRPSPSSFPGFKRRSDHTQHPPLQTNAAILDELLTKWRRTWATASTVWMRYLVLSHNGASRIPWNERQTPPKKFRGGTRHELQQ